MADFDGCGLVKGPNTIARSANGAVVWTIAFGPSGPIIAAVLSGRLRISYIARHASWRVPWAER